MAIDRIIKDGIDRITVAGGMVSDFFSETFDDRKPNRDRPRISGEDPTSSIDKENTQEILKFPHDHPMYYMAFGFSEYKRPSQFQPLKTDGVGDYISLPIPANIRDTSTLTYGDISAGAIVEGLSNIWRASDGARSNSDGFVDSLSNMMSAGTLLSEAAKTAGATGIRSILTAARGASKVIGAPDLPDGALQIAGLADNPFTSVAFQGPEFKTHQFNWRLSPKSKKETQTVRKIIDTFKKVAHPELLSLGVGGFYKYPWIVYVSFGPEDLQKQLYYFKPCVITQISTNYAPDGYPGFYASTKAPTYVDLTISLKEIELWRNGEGTKITEGLPTIESGDFRDIPLPPSGVIDLGSADD